MGEEKNRIGGENEGLEKIKAEFKKYREEVKKRKKDG